MHNNINNIEKELFNINNAAFDELALAICQFQYAANKTYHQYCDALRVNITDIKTIEQIPFLPIQFFKSHIIYSPQTAPDIIFESSGTTGSINSKHHIKDISLYHKSFTKAFAHFYGDIKDYCIIGLLPSYLEKGNSSLVYMVNELIKQSGSELSGFYLYDFEKLSHTLSQNESTGIKTLLIGVTYALLDFADQYKMDLNHTIVMETGGMKGRREELTRGEVHDILKQRLGLAEIHSEYGMTELLSQAYSRENGIFNCAPWMKILIRAADDPFLISAHNNIIENPVTGVVNVIDLANIYSCSFIATDDVGKLYKDGSFEIAGRQDNSDIRGCGLMLL